MIATADAKPGLRVEATDGREYLLLDRAPQARDAWWLQDAETGAIGRDLVGYARYLRAVGDDYRATEFVSLAGSGDRYAVKYRAGDWAVIADRSKWCVVHAPTGAGLGEEAKGLGVRAARALADRLAAEVPRFEERAAAPLGAIRAVLAA